MPLAEHSQEWKMNLAKLRDSLRPRSVFPLARRSRKETDSGHAEHSRLVALIPRRGRASRIPDRSVAVGSTS